MLTALMRLVAPQSLARTAGGVGLVIVGLISFRPQHRHFPTPRPCRCRSTPCARSGAAGGREPDHGSNRARNSGCRSLSKFVRFQIWSSQVVVTFAERRDIYFAPATAHRAFGSVVWPWACRVPRSVRWLPAWRSITTSSPRTTRTSPSNGRFRIGPFGGPPHGAGTAEINSGAVCRSNIRC